MRIRELARGYSGELRLFVAAVTIYGFSQSIVDATFNNFLNETFSITNMQRGVLELPRELPGFLVTFFSALLFFLSPRRLAAFANLLCATGILLIGLHSPEFAVMLCWLFIFSAGQHLFLPLNSAITMEFAAEGKTGRALGRISGLMNFAGIAGSFAVFLGFRFFGFTFTSSYVMAAVGFLLTSVLIFMMKPDRPQSVREKFTLRKEYRLFYWLNILFGTRKQIFLTFAPWVLVTVYHQKTEMVATLLTIGGVIGIAFKPLLGRAIDRLGERTILMGEAVALIGVCLGYGFARFLFSEGTALIVAASCYVADQLLMSVGMARATYLKKIAVAPSDVTQTMTMGVTIDHVFSITVALVSGIIWSRFGYQYIFVMGACIAAINFFSASRVTTGGHRKIEKPRTTAALLLL